MIKLTNRVWASVIYGLVITNLAVYIIGFHGLDQNSDMNFYRTVMTNFLASGNFPNDNPVMYLSLLGFTELTDNLILASELTLLLGIVTCVGLIYFCIRKYFNIKDGVLILTLAFASPLLIFCGGMLKQVYGFIPVLLFIYYLKDPSKKTVYIILPTLVLFTGLTHIGGLALLTIFLIAYTITYHNRKIIPSVTVLIGIIAAFPFIFPNNLKIFTFLFNINNPQFLIQIPFLTLDVPLMESSMGIILYGISLTLIGAFQYSKTKDKTVLFFTITLILLLLPITSTVIYQRMILASWIPALFIFGSLLKQINTSHNYFIKILPFLILSSNIALIFIRNTNLFIIYLSYCFFSFTILYLLYTIIKPLNIKTNLEKGIINDH